MIAAVEAIARSMIEARTLPHDLVLVQLEPRGAHGLRWFTLRGSSPIDGAALEKAFLARFERLIVAHDEAMLRLSPRAAERATFEASSRRRVSAIEEGARKLYPEESGRAPLDELESADDAVWIVHDGVIGKPREVGGEWGSPKARSRVSHAPTWTIVAHESSPRSRPNPASSRPRDPIADARALRREDPTRALETLDRALSSDPRLTAGWRLRGEILLDLGDFGESLAAFERARDLGDATTTTQRSRLLAEAALGRSAERPAISRALLDRWKKRAADLRARADARAERLEAALARLATPSSSPSTRRRPTR